MNSREAMVRGQIAPSTKRCIKTGRGKGGVRFGGSVRKHRAPKGALRLVQQIIDYIVAGQKAPSTKRCIKGSSELGVGGGV